MEKTLIFPFSFYLQEDPTRDRGFDSESDTTVLKYIRTQFRTTVRF